MFYSFTAKSMFFSVSHDNDRIFISGHFAVAEPDFPEGLEYYRYPTGTGLGN